ncbi:MAG TPA: cytochrome c [Vicinamibacterales bacterium]|nr:cytochrome c [Vicinamibacterales bacterium]
MGRLNPWVLSSAVSMLAVSALPAAAQSTGAAPTFSKDVAPIFQAKCQSCHQPDSIAPMSLITYQQSRPWARSIKDRVARRQMPPWHIDPSVGVQEFKNDMSLSDAQIETIVKWVDGGAPQGDPKDMPPAKPLVTNNEWQGVNDGFGPPDLVIKSSEYTMPAVSQDIWYRPMSDIPLTEPRWVKMVEIRPTNLKSRKILHHSIAYLVLNEDPDAVNTGTATYGLSGPASREDLLNRRPQLMEWAIGKGYDKFAEGTGKLVVPGEKISWDQHMHAVGEEITGGSEIGLWFYPKGQEPAKRSYLIGFTGLREREFLDIPPNSVAYTEGFTVLKENTMITNFQPHFHLRGKAMKVEAIKPDGGREIVSYVGNFNFNWMTNYIYKDDAAPIFPKGTIIQVSAWYDNTAANKDNPDPEQWVGYGDRTVDEMAHAWMNVVYYTDDEYKAIVAERKAKAAARTTVDRR